MAVEAEAEAVEAVVPEAEVEVVEEDVPGAEAVPEAAGVPEAGVIREVETILGAGVILEVAGIAAMPGAMVLEEMYAMQIETTAVAAVHMEEERMEVERQVWLLYVIAEASMLIEGLQRIRVPHVPERGGIPLKREDPKNAPGRKARKNVERIARRSRQNARNAGVKGRELRKSAKPGETS